MCECVLSSSNNVESLDRPFFIFGFIAYSTVPMTQFWELCAIANNLVRKSSRVTEQLWRLKLEERDTVESEIARKRLESFRGLNANDYFFVNKSLVVSVLGSLVTYLIVLVQFKFTDVTAAAAAGSRVGQ